MPIQIRTMNDIRVPVVLCNRCQLEIVGAADALVVSRGIDIAAPHFVHSTCASGFIQEQPFEQLTMNLATFLDGLCASTNLAGDATSD